MPQASARRTPLFTNAHGVYDGKGYTTARDAVKIIAQFAKNETLMEISDATYHRAAATDMTGARDMYPQTRSYTARAARTTAAATA